MYAQSAQVWSLRLKLCCLLTTATAVSVMPIILKPCSPVFILLRRAVLCARPADDALRPLFCYARPADDCEERDGCCSRPNSAARWSSANTLYSEQSGFISANLFISSAGGVTSEGCPCVSGIIWYSKSLTSIHFLFFCRQILYHFLSFEAIISFFELSASFLFLRTKNSGRPI